MYLNIKKDNNIYIILLFVFVSGIMAIWLYYSSNDLLTRVVDEETINAEFRDYIAKYKKVYQSDEEYARKFKNYMESIKEIVQLNKESSGPNPARYGLNKFSDMSKEEFVKTYLSGLSKTTYVERNTTGQQQPKMTRQYIEDYIKMNKMPTVVDWRSNGVVGPVLSQEMCGGCWAFSAVGIIESQIAIKSGFLPRLSIQKVLDCAGDGNRGCVSGDPGQALSWLYGTGTVLMLEKQYPLTLLNQTCRRMRLAGYKLEDPGFVGSYLPDEMKLAARLATLGPVAVNVNALAWSTYRGGIIQNNCPPVANHAVQLVGYDLTGELPFYVVRNSWGEEWGDGGYARLAIGRDVCGVAGRVAATGEVCQAAPGGECLEHLHMNHADYYNVS